MFFRNKYKKLFEELVQEYQAEMYRYALRYCGDAINAEDIVADCYTEAWKSIATLRKRDSARAWLYQILRFQCYKWVREKGKFKTVDREDHRESDEPSHSDELDDYIKKDAIQMALGKLDERYRTVFLSVFMEGLNTKETAHALNLPQGTILTRIRRAKKMMKNHLKAYEVEYTRKETKPKNIKLVSGGGND